MAKMHIATASRIGQLIDDQRFKGFDEEARQAFWKLHTSFEKTRNRDDKRLAQAIWLHFGSPDDKAEIKPART